MLMRTDPFLEFDRLAKQLFSNGTRPSSMPMDAYRTDDAFYVHFDLPGVKPEDIDVTVERDVLTVRAERHGPQPDDAEMVASERLHGTFTRQLFLGEGLDTDKLEANYDAGVLTVRLPVAEQARPRKIEIVSGPAREAIHA